LDDSVVAPSLADLELIEGLLDVEVAESLAGLHGLLYGGGDWEGDGGRTEETDLVALGIPRGDVEPSPIFLIEDVHETAV
jgi:hypothetical protein